MNGFRISNAIAKAIAPGALLLTMSGCVHVSETYSSDGQMAYTLDCSGAISNWGMCYQKAGEICSGWGYDVLEKDSEIGYANSSVFTDEVATSYGSTLHYRTMVIACRYWSEY